MTGLRLWIRPDSSASQLRKTAAALVVIAVGLFFPLRMAWHMAQVGENCLSHDACCYIWNVEQFYAGVYEGDWQRFLKDYTISEGSHCVLIPGLIQISLIPLTDWNVHAELGVGFVFAFFKVLLLVSLFGRGRPLWAKSLLFAVLSGLVFSLRHFDSFQFGPAGFFQQTGDLFFLLGCWFLICGPRHTRIAGMAASGICASLSFGTGLVAWPAYGMGMWLLGVRRWSAYALWLAAGAVASTPYWMFRPERPMIAGGRWFSPAHIAKGLTHAFIESRFYETQPAIWTIVGGLGIGLAMFLAVVLFRKYWKTDRAKLAPAIMVFGYAAATLWAITWKRDHFTTWYTVHFAMVWVAIAGMAFLAAESAPRTAEDRFSWGTLKEGRGIFAGVSLLIGLLLIPQARGVDKQNVSQLRSRSPAAVTAFREFRTAPTHYATFPVAVWRWNHSQTVGYASLLEQRGWSVFGRNRTYLLQGDYGLASVTLDEAKGVWPVMWVTGRKTSPASFTDYHRLNLFLYPPNAVSWEVDIPQETATARFCSAVAALNRPLTPGSDGAVCQLSLSANAGESQIVWTHFVACEDSAWEECELDLKPYAGKKVRLTLRAAPPKSGRGDAIVWKCPRIEMQLTKTPPISRGTIIPSNTDPNCFPPFTKDDVLLDVSSDAWGMPAASVALANGEGWSCVTGQTQWDYQREFRVLCHDYPHLLVECSLSKPELACHYLYVVLHLESNGAVHEHGISVPLLNDAGMHAYWLDLRKWDVDPRAEIVKVTLHPAPGPAEMVPADSRFNRVFQLEQVRFIERGR